ncbi:MAG: Tat pathway signal protein, partial [Acidobacteriota bacterium]|nr:Tat pathway signal protein [Acidobacteriota bacterium]
IIAHEKPDGFTDNHWAGQGRESMCYCVNCKSKFRQASGKDLPTRKDWNDPGYRQWIEWSHKRRLETWDLFTNTTKAAGGPDCIWSGMLSGNFVGAASSFRDMKELCERADIIMLDQQGRAGVNGGFQENGDTGKRIHGLGGWDKIAPESMATYAPRKAARPIPEVRMWMVEGVAGGIAPWWHHVGGYQEDRRQFLATAPFFQWHAKHQHYLINREPIATVGIVYSQRNFEWYGRDDGNTLALAPYNGMTQAMIRARIPYIAVHADNIDRGANKVSLLVLPNLASMSNSQVESVRRFVSNGGSLVATDETSLYDEYGDRRPDFALGDLFGAQYTGRRVGPRNASATDHSYLRLTPDVGQDVDGPRHRDEPAKSAARHPTLRGFEGTNILTFGGVLHEVKPAQDSTVLLTFVPVSPTNPPENSWMRTPRTQIPGLIVREQKGARIAYLPADIDRRYEQGNIPDHGDLLKNVVHWAAKDTIPLEVKGPGLIDCHLYRQQDRLVLHLVNLTSAGTWRAPVEELIPVGPLTVRMKVPAEMTWKRLLLTVSAETAMPVRQQGGWVQFEVKSVLDHEVVVLE